MTRELVITYGGVAFGSAASGREITGWTVNSRKFGEATVEFDFFISKTTEAAFATEIDAVEDAFEKPFQDLTIVQGSTTLYSFSQSSNTGFDAVPEIVKKEDVGSGRHRAYKVRIRYGLPATTTGELVSGLREHSVEVAYDSSRIRTVTVAGVFTAASSNSARAQYEATVSSLETSVFSTLGIAAANRELVDEPVADHTYNNKTISFRRVWRELVFSQAGASLNDSAIVAQVLRISRLKEGPGDSPDARRLITLRVEYDASVDKSVTTDLRAKYSSMRAWVISQISATLEGGSVALIEEEPQFNYDKNQISIRMMAYGAANGNAPMEREITVEDDHSFGHVLVAAWTGDPLSKYKYDGPAERRRTITDRKRLRGFVYADTSEDKDGGVQLTAAAGIDVLKNPLGLDIVHISQKPTYVHRTLGRLGNTINVTDITKVDTYTYFKNLIPRRPAIST